uniref:Uncharacterized protein n=1 Tax=Lepeophtheirus salmonis TaxID=72036 RepID=A0A0K2TXK6_LEPSM
MNFHQFLHLCRYPNKLLPKGFKDRALNFEALSDKKN